MVVLQGMVEQARTTRWTLCLLALLAILSGKLGKADEPVERFLERLREEQLFDLAEIYLEDLAARDLLSDKYRNDLPLERLLLSMESAKMIRSADQRGKKLDQVEAGLQEFVSKNGKHTRLHEARLKLAELLLSRGTDARERMKGPKATEEDSSLARTSFENARNLFESIMKDLQPILQEMQGARIAADDADKLALREKLVEQFRQAEMLRAICARFYGETYAADSADFKKWLELADTELADIIKKSPSASGAGRRIFGRLYRGEIQALLGNVDEASHFFREVKDVEDQGGKLRVWRVEAMTQLLKLQANPEQKKHEAVLEEAEEILKKMSNAERNLPHWLELQLAIAEARLNWASLLETQANGQGRAKAQRNEAKGRLQVLAKRPSPAQERAKTLLSSIGVDTAKSEESALPEVKGFAEGIAIAQERLNRIDNSAVTLELLNSRVQGAPAEEKEAIQKEIEGLQGDNRRFAREGEELLTQTLNRYSREDSREELLKARHLMAFALLKQEKYWEAAAASDFVTRTSGGSPLGLSAGRFARVAYDKLIESVEGEEKLSFQNAYERLANFMLATWPQAEETQDAALSLINYSLQRKDWGEVERFMGFLPAEGEKSDKVRREVGVILYARYLLAVDELKKQGLAAGSDQASLLQKAEVILQRGLETLQASQLDQRSVEAGNSLAAIYLKSHRYQEAQQVLEKPEVGPLVVLQVGTLALTPSVRLEAVRLGLQAMVLSALQRGEGLDSAKIESAIQQMSEIAKETPDGATRMSNSLILLAQDLRQQVEQIKAPGEKLKLAKGMQLMLTRLGTSVAEVGTIEWAASNLLSLSQSLEANAATKSESLDLAKQADQLYDRVAKIESDKPGSLAAAGKKPDDVLIRHAIAARSAGNFETAIANLESVLKRSPNSLQPHMEIAKAFQQKGTASKDLVTLKASLFGQAPSWGWIKISRVLQPEAAKDPKVFEFFCESRYQLTESQYQVALLDSADKRDGHLKNAKSAIRSTVSTTPKFKESSWYGATEELLKKIQKDLNQPTNGYKEFD